MSVTKEHLFDDKLLDMIKENHEAINIEIYYIIKHNNLYRFVDNAGNTLLHFASKYYNFELIQFLIDAGSEVSVQNLEGKTPILLALENSYGYMTKSQGKTIEVLCEANADIYIIDKYGKSAANLVFNNRSPIYGHSFKLFFHVLEKQFVNNNELIAKKLLSLGCSLKQAIFLKNAEILECMIREGCPVDSLFSWGQTALHVAVSYMDLRSVEVLIKYNADVTIRDNNGFTPLACYGVYWRPNERQYPEILQLLLNKIFALNIDNKEQFLISEIKNILECVNKEAIQILLEHCNYTLFVENDRYQSSLHRLAINAAHYNNPDIFDILQSRKYDVNVRDYRGYTPLHYALTDNGSHVNVFKVLLENGADVNAKSQNEYVPLFLLCENKIIPEKKYRKILQLLIQNGLDIQFYGLNKITAFDIIIENKLFYRAKQLLARLAVLEEQGNHLKEHIRFKIDSHLMLKNYFSICKDKLKKMKHNSINLQLTLYSFLVEQDEKILRSCKLEQKALFKLQKLTKRRSSYYYNIVQKHISRIVKKLELKIKSRSIICNLLKIIDDPNHVVVTEIINYLNDEDMKNLCEFDL